MNDSSQTEINHGSAKPAKTVKAGCGIRYHPEELGEHTCFDFSAAEKLKKELDKNNKT
jgi:hypothetical protein